MTDDSKSFAKVDAMDLARSMSKMAPIPLTFCVALEDGKESYFVCTEKTLPGVSGVIIAEFCRGRRTDAKDRRYWNGKELTRFSPALKK